MNLHEMKIGQTKICAGIWAWPESREEIKKAVDSFEKLLSNPNDKEAWKTLYRVVGGDHYMDIYAPNQAKPASLALVKKLVQYTMGVCKNNGEQGYDGDFYEDLQYLLEKTKK